MIKKMLKCSWLIIIASLAITAFFGWQLRKISIENTVRMYMPQSSESYQRMLKAEEDYGSMMVLGISMETSGETILTPEYIKIVQDVTDQIGNVDYVESIDSIANMDFIVGEDGSLKASSILGEDYTGSPEDMAAIKQRLVDWQEMYNRVIITDDGKTTQLMITLQPKDENGNMLNSKKQMKALHDIQKICETALEGSDLEVRYFGDPVLSDNGYTFMVSDLLILIPFVALVVLLSLYFSFHTWSGTLLPLITVLMATVWSVGIMCMLNVTFTIIGSVIPVCLVACGSAYGIHVLTHYYIGLDKIEGEITKESHAGAIEYGLKDVWIAVVLAGVTTVAGFISNITSPIMPLKSFSVFAAAGVVFSLLLSMTFIPAMLYVTPISKVGKHWRNKNRISAKLKMKLEKQLKRQGGKTSAEATTNTLYMIYHFFSGTKPRLIVSTAVLILVAVIGFKMLIVDTALVNYFPPDSKFREDISYVDEHLAGSNTLYLIVSGEEKDAEEVAAESAGESVADSVASDFDFGTSDTGAADSVASDFDFGTSDTGAADSVASDFDFGSSTDDFGFGEAASGTDDFGFGDASGADSSESAEAPKQYYMLTNPEILNAVDGMQEYLLARHEGIGKMVSFTTFIKRMNQVMNSPVDDAKLSSTITVQQGLEMLHKAYTSAGGKDADVQQIVLELERQLNFNGLDYYEVPYDVAKYPVSTRDELGDLVTQYLYLLSSEQIQRFANNMTMPTAIRTQVQLRTHSTDDTAAIIADAQAYAAKHFPKGYKIEATGNGEMEYTMTKMVVDSQTTSILLSLAMVFIIISLSFKSAWAGIIGAIPLGLTILLNFMVMGYAGIALDLCTSIIASVAIGVGIDYTIHFMETYRAQRALTDDLEEVTKNTFKTSGRGILTNAIAVGLGFCVLLFSRFIILRYIGALVAVVMFTSSTLAMTVIPGILNAFDPKFMWSKEQKEAYAKKITEEK
ncbi:MAG: MMPL family transporter [Treponema sp.]|uniref:MMPL family transporter n=1 Tax=Treponema sp. TaxID=166 RepID=UPI0025FA51E5|nr:MMPL family transporter [Treponema sp.]MBR0494901.1 MMPL family transporter [Treponema sp.]